MENNKKSPRKAEKFLDDLKKVFEASLKKQIENLDGVYQKIADKLDNLKYTADSAFIVKQGEKYKNIYILYLHCTQSNDSICKININDNIIEYPPGSFVKGAIYRININEVVENGNSMFVAYY